MPLLTADEMRGIRLRHEDYEQWRKGCPKGTLHPSHDDRDALLQHIDAQAELLRLASGFLNDDWANERDALQVIAAALAAHDAGKGDG